MARVFIDVDTQVDFCAPGGALYVQGAPEAVTQSAKLVTAAVSSGSWILGSVDSHAHDAWEFATNTNLGPQGAKPNFPPHCVKGTPGWLKLPETLPARFAFVPVVPDPEAASRIPPNTQAVYFEKEVYSLFANPNAAAVLDALCPAGPTDFVVFGVATDYCVRAAALGLLGWASSRETRAGTTVTVVTDAIAAVTADGGRAALEELRAAGALLRTTDAVLGGSPPA